MYPVAEKLPNEIERSAFVEALALIGTDQQEEYYSYCEIGKLISGFDKAMVSLIDSRNQCVLSADGAGPFENSEWPVESSFCQHVIAEITPTVVFDVSKHPIFGLHPHVLDGSMTGSYCGFPIRTSSNIVLGTYCLANNQPSELGQEKVDAIDNMVAKLGAYLERQSKVQAETSDKLLIGLKFIKENYPNLTINNLCNLLEFRSGFVLASNEVEILISLGFLGQTKTLTHEGAQILERLHLYQKALTPHKRSYSSDEEEFDALFEGL